MLVVNFQMSTAEFSPPLLSHPAGSKLHEQNLKNVQEFLLQLTNVGDAGAHVVTFLVLNLEHRR